MKKIVIPILLIVLCVFIYSLVGYSKIQNKYVETTKKEDYPLLDVIFDDKSDWVVIIRTDLFTEDEKYYVSQNAQNLNMNKEYLKLLTFPVGRGTTPFGIVYIYQNKKLIKEVPFIEIYYENTILQDAFKIVSKENINKLINDSLPSPI